MRTRVAVAVAVAVAVFSVACGDDESPTPTHGYATNRHAAGHAASGAHAGRDIPSRSGMVRR